MNAVKKDVEALVGKELEAANKKFPLFKSPHEGYAVLLEEIDELKYEVKTLKIHKKALWKFVKANHQCDCIERLNQIKLRAVCAAIEAIQVAAMCEKFKMSLGEEKRGDDNA